MSDPIKRIKDLAEGMTPQERYYLANADYLKLRQLILQLTPEGLLAMQEVFISPSYRAAHPAAKRTCDDVSFGAFTPDAIAAFDKFLKELDEVGLHEEFGFPVPEGF